MKFTLNLSHLLQPGYWIDPTPGTAQLLFLIISLFISLLLFIGGVGVWYLNRKKFKSSQPKFSFWQKVMWVLYSFSTTALLLTFFRSQNLGWVSLRILWVILLLGILVFTGYFFYSYRTSIPKKLQQIETENLKKKYFRTPKTKKKKVR